VVLGWVGMGNVAKQTQSSRLAVIMEVIGGWLVLCRTSSLVTWANAAPQVLVLVLEP